MQDVGGRRDRVGPEEDRQSGQPGRGDQAVGQRGVAVDVAVQARRQRRGLDLVLDRELLGRLAVVPAGLEGGDVRLHDLGLGRELGLKEAQRAVGGPVVEPGEHAEREHVLRPLGVLLADLVAFERLDRDRGDRDRVQLVAVERAVLERVGLVADLLQVPLGELVGVRDDVGASGQVIEVGLERGRVHRDEHVGRVARGQDVVVGEVQLEARHSWQRACWCPDLGREVGQRGQVVPEGSPSPG